MRIIAGKYKKSNLFTVPGFTSRPTTDFLREVIFSVVFDWEDKTVLDLFAGSGSLGFEAISRGANSVDFVDASEKAIKTILKNKHKLGCENCRIHKKRVNSFLRKCETKFDMIFLDPPYEKNLVNDTLNIIFENRLLRTGGIIIAEHSVYEKIDEKFREKIQNEKTTKHSAVTFLGER
ncbi:MAG: 16S rRNA (guanine(966)-N(2))-methyltransferase RsmD [Candidatus Cloacimonas sp. 4484_275]|nr:MAG: 16S rRNA (guanine(966)-N(2))-methyltransferase RsmD [Candidatus Cloacimonas sp. 4484_275]